jgi:hypothetical protein
MDINLEEFTRNLLNESDRLTENAKGDDASTYIIKLTSATMLTSLARCLLSADQQPRTTQ